jgi:hypothetical protein
MYTNIRVMVVQRHAEQTDSLLMEAPRDQSDHVVPGDPPASAGWQRQSFWVLALREARQHGRWVRIQRMYTASTAAQISSDIRSAHMRDLDTLRVRGILPGERWEARWGTDDKCPPGNFAIWVRHLGDGTSAEL